MFPDGPATEPSHVIWEMSPKTGGNREKRHARRPVLQRIHSLVRSPAARLRQDGLKGWFDERSH